MLVKNLVVASLVGLQGFSVFASAERDAKIKSIFAEIKKISKGALGPNAYQGPLSRSLVMQDGVIMSPPKGNLITVAFRSAKAAELAAIDFYIGNRYASNYWELNNQYLATPEEQLAVAFRFSPLELKAKPEALPTALSMAKHQMLELYYMSKSPTSTLTKSYQQRGVSDADHELKYYRLYADYLASNIKYENDYVVFVEFQKNSGLLPGKKTISLSGIRLLVADISTKFDLYLTPDKASEFRRLRNSIHNGMNKSVIAALTKFQNENAAVILPEDVIQYESLKSQIAMYYKTDKDILTVLVPAIKTDLPEAAALIAKLAQSGNSLQALAAVSNAAVSARLKFGETKNIDLTHFIVRAQEFIDAELGNLSIESKEDLVLKAKTLVNMSYATGLLSPARRTEILAAIDANPASAISLLNQALSEGIATYASAFEPALTDWKLVSTSVASYVDDGIRSSSLIGLDATVTQLKKVVGPAPVAPVAPVNPGNGAIQKPVSDKEKGLKLTTPYHVETEGLGYGYLTFIPRLETEKLTKLLNEKMIPVFESLPLDLGVVAGTITEEEQTPLSHVNIKSKNRKTPNVYFPKASLDATIKPLLAKKALVRMELKDGVFWIREATLAEAEAFWASLRNDKPTITLRADLAEKRIRSTDKIGFNDVISIGAKAANYSEATHFLPEAFRAGWAIPFYYYREFIRTNTMDGKISIEQHMVNLLKDPRIRTDKAFLVDSLAKVQARMNEPTMIVNKDLVAQLKALVSVKYPGRKIRLRSSTNSEDMPNFTGAGLYDSGAYNPNKPTETIEKALQYVWSSVWNLRAFEERDAFKMNHLDVSMAILVSPAYPKEFANGVGVSRNIIKPELGEGFYLNIQRGSDAVTNPDSSITPDQVLVLKKPDPVKKTKYTLIYTKYSNLPALPSETGLKTAPEDDPKAILPYKEVEKLADYLQSLHDHFKAIYHPKNDNPKFALDVEFKVDNEDGSRKVHYKQARPFVGL